MIYIMSKNNVKKNNSQQKAGTQQKAKNPNRGKPPPKRAQGIALRSATAKEAVVHIRQQQQRVAQAKRRGLPRDSVNFFTSAIDPMHDVSIPLCGWPDRNIEQSVIRKMPQSFPLKMPIANPNFTTTEVWDCHIHLNPWLNAIQFKETNRVNNNTFDIAPNTCVIGGLQAYATNSGVDFTYGADNAIDTGTVPLIGLLEVEPDISVGVGRLIGIGVEVVNTTASLYQSGMVYSWRAPEPQNDPETWYQSASSSTTPSIVYLQNAFDAEIYRHPPANIASAQLYTGYEKWHAKEGSYMVGTFNDFENPAKMVSYQQPVIIQNQDQEDHTWNPSHSDGATNETMVWVPIAVPGTVVTSQFGLPANKIYPINQMGMIFTGLTKETTLTMMMTYYYESFPSLAQSNILTLARPSTRYDALALKLLAETMRTLPVAVMSKENAEGDWWDRVLQAVQLVAPGVMAMLPGGEVLSPGVLAAVTSLRAFRNDK